MCVCVCVCVYSYKDYKPSVYLGVQRQTYSELFDECATSKACYISLKYCMKNVFSICNQNG